MEKNKFRTEKTVVKKPNATNDNTDKKFKFAKNFSGITVRQMFN